MHCSYKDITAKLGQPLWWDEYAVPRYCLYHPTVIANIYANETVLVEVHCQSCNYLFMVAMSWDVFAAARGHTSLANRIKIGEIWYGDPPNYGCCAAGPTETANMVQVLEYWQRKDGKWLRDRELEVKLCDWEDEDDESILE